MIRVFITLAAAAALGNSAWAVGRGGGGARMVSAPAARPAPNTGARPAPAYTGGGQPWGGVNRPVGVPSGGWSAPGSLQPGRPEAGAGAAGPSIRPQQPIQGGPSVFRPSDGSYTRPGGGSVLYPSSPSGGWSPPSNLAPGGASHPNSGGLTSVSRPGTTLQSGTRYINNSAFGAYGNQVRASYANVNAFHSNAWWGRYPNAWRPVGWTRAASYWAWANWAAWSAFAGYAQPVYYDYGSNVVFEGESVYQDGSAIGTQEIYADQAANIASTGRLAQASGDDTWMSLGVFAMTQGGDTSSGKFFQLAVNKAGVIRGNYYDDLTQTTLPVYGQVDARSQRACWTVGDKKEVVYEAGAANLTRDQTTMLVHLGKDKTQQWALVRLAEPAGP